MIALKIFSCRIVSTSSTSRVDCGWWNAYQMIYCVVSDLWLLQISHRIRKNLMQDRCVSSSLPHNNIPISISVLIYSFSFPTWLKIIVKRGQWTGCTRWKKAEKKRERLIFHFRTRAAQATIRDSLTFNFKKFEISFSTSRSPALPPRLPTYKKLFLGSAVTINLSAINLHFYTQWNEVPNRFHHHARLFV